MLFYSSVKGATSLTNVAKLTRAGYLVDASALSMINRVFNGSHFLLNGLHGFERGCDILLLKNFSNFVGNPFNIRKVGSFVRFSCNVIIVLVVVCSCGVSVGSILGSF